MSAGLQAGRFEGEGEEAMVSIKSCIIVSSILVLSLSAWRGTAAEEPILLWPGLAPGETGDIGPEQEQPKRPGDNTIRLTNVTRPSLEVFPVPREKNTGAAVVICPGGGYGILAYNKEGTEVAEWLNTIGVTGIVLKYRVPARKDRARYEAPLQDAQRALGIVRQRAGSLKIDPQRVGILGFSAGGHLSATLSNQYEKRTYPRVDEADDLSCRPDFALLIYPAYLVERKADTTLAPELKVTSKTPPTFLAQTEDDGVRVECSLFYYLALKNAKVPAEMHLYPDGGHGYGLRPSAHNVSTWPQRAGEWLRALGVLEPGPPAAP
jgi:acetyl esterase/lipase